MTQSSLPVQSNLQNINQNQMYHMKKQPALVSVTIPLYNEEESVTPLINRLDETLTGVLANYEVILVDDGSSDNTITVARNTMANKRMDIKLVALQRNFGQTAAMQAGIDQASGDIIVTLDGDLQNDPIDIPRMIDALYERDLDLLVGWREKRKDAFIVRKIPSKVANLLIGKITKVKLHDYGCSLKIYRAKVIKQVRLLGEMHRFIPAWVAVVIPSNRIGEMPVTHHARQFGESKYGLSRTIRVLIDLLSVLFFMRYRARPGHFFGTIGLFLGIIGGVMLSYLAVNKFVLGHDIGTRPMLLVGVMLVISSIQMLCTGIIAEMITRNQHASKQQKQSYIVGDVFAENDFSHANLSNHTANSVNSVTDGSVLNVSQNMVSQDIVNQNITQQTNARQPAQTPDTQAKPAQNQPIENQPTQSQASQPAWQHVIEEQLHQNHSQNDNQNQRHFGQKKSAKNKPYRGRKNQQRNSNKRNNRQNQNSQNQNKPNNQNNQG